MRLTPPALALGLLVGGCVQIEPRDPPIERFYYPTGIVHVDVGAGEGTLYVASANSDRCYDFGALRAVSLDQLPEPLPAIGAPVPPTGPVQLASLGSQDPSLQRNIQTFANELAAWPLPSGGYRLFVPTRAEGSLLHVIDATGPASTTLSCVPAPETDASNCTQNAIRLVDVPPGSTETDFPRAPAPFGVAASPAGQVFVTHTVDADSPRGSFLNERAYVVRFDAASATVGLDNFVEVPQGGTQSVAIGQRYAFVTARSLGSPANPGLDLVTAVPLDPADRTLRSFPLQRQFASASARGIALNADETRLYVVGRNPDILLVVDVRGARTAFPSLEVVRAVPLPATPGPVRLIERPGKGTLVILTSQSTGSLSIYDDGLGQLATEVLGIGLQPFGLAVDLRETTGEGGAVVRQARIFVSNFGDGRIAVVDVPDLDQPEEARVVAHLGARQNDVQGTQSVTCRVGE